MSKREVILAAACKENAEDFLHFIQLHNDKTDPFDVEEVVQEMSRDQRETLWGKLSLRLQDVLSKLPPERWDEKDTKDEGQQDMEVDTPLDSKHVRAVVEGVTLVAAVSVHVLRDGEEYTALLGIVNVLHDVLVLLPISEAPLLSALHALCECWWKKGLEEKEKFGRTALAFSLRKCFGLKRPNVEIQRIWNLHEVVLTLDYTSDDNKEITDLLLQCFYRSDMIRNDDGKRFLVFLFSWNINFIWVLHGTIKNQLEFFSKKMLVHIMEIYFRAWKKASGDFLNKIESACIQDFMQNAILLHRASPVYSKVRQIVSYFHLRKGCHQVDKMLYTLYKPILWKALNAPNSEVRANATLIFTEAFPIHDPDDAKNLDTVVQKQLDAAMSLLNDPHPIVRSNAVLGVCKILGKCWELFPPIIITDFLKKIVLELATDTSSADVRCSVFKCLTIVLDNALSHPLLEKLLPNIKYSLHDNSEKVRTAFLDMLLKVKAVRAAKFWDVCHMDHLLARLATDTQSVSKRIVNLLFKSFFPVNESEKEWCCRCITLIQMNPMAARRFYQFAFNHTAPTNIIKLMLAIRRVLNKCVMVDGEVSDMNDSNKENSTIESAVLGKDMTVVASLLEIVVILWRSVEKTLKQNKEAQKFTCAKFGSVMGKYFCAFEDARCTPPLIQMASFMPPAAVPTFSCGVLSKLRRMESGAVPTQYSQLLDCLCSWGQAAEIVELISDWLSKSLPKEADKAGPSRKVRIQETVEAKPGLALAYLDYLLTHNQTREKVLGLGQRPLKHLHSLLGDWKLVLFAHLKSSEDPSSASVQTALRAFTCHGRFGAHLEHNSTDNERDFLLSLELDASWISERVLPFMIKPNENECEVLEAPLSLAVQIIEGFLLVCRDVLIVGLSDETFRGQILHLCSLILLSDGGYRCIPGILPILKEVADSYVPEDNEALDDPENQTTVILGVVANIFQKMIELLARRLRKDPEEGQQLCQLAAAGLSDFLQAAQSWDRAPLNGVFSTLFAVIVVEKSNKLNKISHPEEVIVPETLEDMPPLPSVLLSIILKSPSVTKSFLAEIGSSLDSEVIESLTELAAVLHILAVIKRTGKFKSGLKSVAECVQRQLNRHAIVAVDGGDIQRVIYESSVKTINNILDL
ncbi:condensin-2 complex subunit G2 [Eucyclogobius newberryi]|uniref:condensin-2 complex subunit G2 n=1 Tax=Eucyclogobius newberryi TaxID=166745 RepID=UPI003B5B4FEA